MCTPTGIALGALLLAAVFALTWAWVRAIARESPPPDDATGWPDD